MNNSLNFDMDGVLANLYGVTDWLPKLRAEDASPYLEAKPLVNCNVLARRLNKLHAKGWTINIISWTSKCGSDEYMTRIAEAKRKWLKKHLPSVRWDNIHIIAYGTPKQNYGSGILFDDEEPNRNAWKGIAIKETEMMSYLATL